MRWFALVVLACAGCDVVFGLQHLDTVPVADAGGDAGAPSGPCSAITMLADNFATNDIPVLWPLSTTGAITVHDNELDLDIADPGGYATLDSTRYFDLREGALSLSLTTDDGFTMDDSVTLQLLSERAGNSAQITRSNGQLVFQLMLPDTGMLVVANFAYDPIEDAYLRIRHPGAELVLETSPDGVAYANRATSEDGADMTFVRVVVQSHRGAAAPELHTYVADVNGGTPTGTACPLASLQDDFSATMLDSKWARSSVLGAGVLTPGGGLLRMSAPLDGSYATLLPSTFYDLRNSSFVIEVPRALGASTSGVFVMVIGTVLGDTLEFTDTGDKLSGDAHMAGNLTMPFSKTYDAQMMRWWRISTADTMTWETSPDGVTWQLRGEMTLLAGLDRADVGLGLSVYTGNDEVDVAHLDLPP